MPVTIEAWRITGQSQIDSYVGRWAELAVILVNELHVTRARGRPVTPPAELHPAFAGDVTALNQVLVRHAAVPNLHGDPPVLAFHGPEADLPDAWAADAATALAMVIGVGQGVRLRSCEAEGCELVFFDVTRNASRRFCGLSCQNRAKASAYRARRRA